MIVLADARRKSLTMSSKEKTVILTLGFITVLFVGCNMPQSVLRITTAFAVFNTNSNGYKVKVSLA